MRIKFLIVVLIQVSLLSCQPPQEETYLFFLHNRFLEEHAPGDIHPDYGEMQYHEIIEAFEDGGLQVITDVRKGNVNARTYARGVVSQIDSLKALGIPSNRITVLGTSKGGYIAQYVSTLANDPNLNFVFVACYQAADLANIPEINYCGNILTIYEKSDNYGSSSLQRKLNSTCRIKHFKEIALNTGLGHGFLFKPMPEWIAPSIRWAHREYELD